MVSASLCGKHTTIREHFVQYNLQTKKSNNNNSVGNIKNCSQNKLMSIVTFQTQDLKYFQTKAILPTCMGGNLMVFSLYLQHYETLLSLQLTVLF